MILFKNFRNNKAYEWACKEVSPWIDRSDSRDEYDIFLSKINEAYKDITVLDIKDNEVKIRRKQNSHIQLEEGGQDALRLKNYLELFKNALRRSSKPMQVSLAISTGDTIDFSAEYPIFCLQKTVDAPTILIPDVDFGNFDYYDDAFTDRHFLQKMDQVIFCGSSTGTILTDDDVINNKSDRLKLAHRFVDHDDIIIKIGSAVQCVSESGLNILRRKPYFEAIPWPDQLRRRYILSIDGNGATCSRVVLTLRSQSLLLKYRSNERLFYFHGLQPMVHYVPISDAEDLLCKLSALRTGEINAVQIVKNANAFFKKHLRRKSVEEYLINLITVFQSNYFDKL